jgi:hypothetical protein
MSWKHAVVAGSLAVSAACASDTSTGPAAMHPSLGVGNEGLQVTGGGQLVHPTLGPFTFSVSAIEHGDGGVTGRWEYHYYFADVQYQGDVTCFAVDPINHRAWIGGVITFSNDPDPNPIFSPGHDAWFRLLDNGNSGTDRITVVGFEGAAGIFTSEQYCAMQIWPDANARTWPIEAGNVTIHD